MMPFRFRNVIPVSLLAVSGLLLAGCTEPESVRSGTESRPDRPATPSVSADQKQYRILAAMIPNSVLPKPDEPNSEERGEWFFIKLSGPAAEVAKHEEAFRKLVDSLQVLESPTSPLAWNTPPGWVEGEQDKSRMVIATLKPIAKDAPVEITLSRAGGTVLMNVNRWRGQLGIEPVSAAALDASVVQRSAAGRLTLIADMAGPKNPADTKPKMMNPH
jgi:hypothetical protein